MRQVESKSLGIRRLSFLLAVLLLVLTSCRDNPKDKAAKAVHEQIDKALHQAALKEIDVAQAQQLVEKAIGTDGLAGLAKDSAYLVNGHLMLSRGLTLQADLSVKATPVRKAVDAIASELMLSQQRLLEKERIDKMLALQDSEIAELGALIAGIPGQPGLQARMTEADAEMKQLVSQKEALQKEQASIQAVLDDYKAQSEDLLKKADLAKGDEKLGLQQQAYTLLLERKDDYVQIQSAENAIAILDGQIALIQTRVGLLQDNLQKTKAQIDALETAQSRQLLKSQQVELTQLLSEQQKRIYDYADAIKAGLDAYRQAAQEVCDVLEQAAQQYQKVVSGDAGLSASVRQADSYTYAAMAYAEQVAFLREAATRLTGIVASADETLVRGLPERLPLSVDLDPEQLQKVMSLYDLADKAYDDAIGRAQRIGEQGKETACSVLKSQILSVHNKMKLADALGQYDLANQVQARLEELKTKGQEFGSLFTLSETARLLEQGLAYVPSLPVNVELYFEAIRQRFGEWKQLTTPEQQAAAVEANLVEMDGLVRTYGDEMGKLLDPVKQEMLAAKERGFTAPATSVSKPGDPNSI